jgi:hypothetical protein
LFAIPQVTVASIEPMSQKSNRTAPAQRVERWGAEAGEWQREEDKEARKEARKKGKREGREEKMERESKIRGLFFKVLCLQTYTNRKRKKLTDTNNNFDTNVRWPKTRRRNVPGKGARNATVYAIAATTRKNRLSIVKAGSSRAHWFFVCLW